MGGCRWPRVACRPPPVAEGSPQATLDAFGGGKPVATPFSLFKFIYIYNFLSSIYLYYFIKIDTCRHFNGADVTRNGICQNF
jgi:hypothetical protein